ncbi:MAG: 2-dehydropantoate 2-reductase N-terminal domain-containing protein [Candidatus Omnitrophota bacterium]
MSAQKFIKKKAKTGEKKLKPTKPVEAVVEKPEVKEEPVVPLGKMKICVIGAGAMGGLIAACLKAKRRIITLIGKPDQIRAIRSNGLKVEGVKNTVYVEIDIKESMQEKADLVILAVKIQDIKNVLDNNRSFLLNTPILTIQDGIRADKIVSLALGEENIISSIVMFGSTYLKPNLISYDFEGDWIIGKLLGENNDKVKEIAEEISPAFKVTITEDIASKKWMQLIVVATHCIPALLGKSTQEAFSNLDMAQLAVLLLKENFAVVNDAGIKLADLPNFDLNKLQQLTSLPVKDAAQAFSEIVISSSKQIKDISIINKISMDYLLEMDHTNGEIIRLARFGRVGAQLNTKSVNLANKVKKINTFLNYAEISKVFNQGLIAS